MRIEAIFSFLSKAMGAPKGTFCKKIKIKILHIDKMFLQTFNSLWKVSFGASMTLEASIALPLFIFFFVNVLSIINIIKVQSDLEAALHQTGSDIIQLAYDYKVGEETILGGSEEGGIITQVAFDVLAAGKVRDYLGDKIDKCNVAGGKGGLVFLNSSIMKDNDIVDIVVDYKVKPFVPIIGFKDFPLEARFYGHAFTGYDISGGMAGDDTEEEMVYVTENGVVYHKDIGCKHLKQNVTSVPVADISGKRNADGSKYYPCQYCGKKAIGGNVFITNYGNRYHSSINCPGLKRKIYTIPISEVGGRGPCSACG